jgi:hypothetical protein
VWLAHFEYDELHENVGYQGGLLEKSWTHGHQEFFAEKCVCLSISGEQQKQIIGKKQHSIGEIEHPIEGSLVNFLHFSLFPSLLMIFNDQSSRHIRFIINDLEFDPLLGESHFSHVCRP